METIYSLVTKPILQNVAIIRISGPKTFEAINNLIQEKVKKTNTSKLIFRKLYTLNKEFIDDVILLSFETPNSFTGEDVIEIQCHGSPFVVNKILDELSNLELRQAVEGEFTKIAFENGKIDLSYANSINTLILSNTKFMAESSSKNLNNFQTNIINSVTEKLENLVSKIYVRIDYPENEDLPDYSNETIISVIDDVINLLDKDINLSNSLLKINEGLKLTIIGEPNVGKSSLFNLLVGSNRAIVTDIPGTTRDVVDANVLFGIFKVNISDTAGVRESNDVVEKIGIQKTKESIKDSDIVIGLIDGSKNIIEQIKSIEEISSDSIIVMNKKDLTSERVDINISIVDNDVKELLEKLNNLIEDKYNIKEVQNASLVNELQINQYKLALKNLKKAKELVLLSGLVDVAIIEIESAINSLYKMEGKVLDKDYIQKLFSKFCIGK